MTAYKCKNNQTVLVNVNVKYEQNDMEPISTSIQQRDKYDFERVEFTCEEKVKARFFTGYCF